MGKAFKRSDRVASELQKQLSIIFQRDINTTNLGMVSVSEVEVSPDLFYCKVFLTFLDVGNSAEFTVAQKIKELNHQIPYIRSLIAKSVQLRVVPTLKFEYDASGDQYRHIDSILKSIK